MLCRSSHCPGRETEAQGGKGPTQGMEWGPQVLFAVEGRSQVRADAMGRGCLSRGPRAQSGISPAWLKALQASMRVGPPGPAESEPLAARNLPLGSCRAFCGQLV